MAIQNDPIITLPVLNVNGLKISNDGTTPDEIITIGAGTARDSNNKIDLLVRTCNEDLQGGTVSSPLSVNNTVNGAGGLDTGSVAASSVYSFYVIGDSRYYQPTAGILSLASNSSPTLPFGYDSFRKVGYAVTDSSSDFLLMDIAGTGDDRWFVYDAPQATAVTAGASTTYTAVGLLAFVPPVEDTPVNLSISYNPNSASNDFSVHKFGVAGDQIVIRGQVSSVIVKANVAVLAGMNVTNPSVAYKVGNASDAVAINVASFRYFI